MDNWRWWLGGLALLLSAVAMFGKVHDRRFERLAWGRAWRATKGVAIAWLRSEALAAIALAVVTYVATPGPQKERLVTAVVVPLAAFVLWMTCLFYLNRVQTPGRLYARQVKLLRTQRRRVQSPALVMSESGGRAQQIAAFREMIRTVDRQTRMEKNRDRTLTSLLEQNLEFLAFRPYLSARSKASIYGRTVIVPPENVEMNGTLHCILEDIDGLEHEWGLSVETERQRQERQQAILRGQLAALRPNLEIFAIDGDIESIGPQIDQSVARQFNIRFLKIVNNGGAAHGLVARLFYDDQVSIASGLWLDANCGTISLPNNDHARLLVAAKSDSSGDLFLTHEDTRKCDRAYSYYDANEAIKIKAVKGQATLRVVLVAGDYQREFRFTVVTARGQWVTVAQLP